MQDSADKFMALWLKLPQQMESLVEHKLKDGMAQFDLQQSAMRGIAKDEEGNQIPFVCFRVHVIDPSAMTNSHVGQQLLNTFKVGGQWKSNLSSGTKISFKEDVRSDRLFRAAKELMTRGNFEMPVLNLQSVQKLSDNF